MRPMNGSAASKTLCIEGWRGINHSIGMVNQNQILEWLKLPGWQLYHRDAPYFLPHWSRSSLSAGFSAEEQALIDAVPPPPEGQLLDGCYRIASPIRLGQPGSARRTGTFVVTEVGDLAFEPEPLDTDLLTQGDDFVVTPSHWARERLVERGFKAEAIRVVPHGYKTDVFQPLSPAERLEARQRVGIAEHEIVLCNVGVSTWNKGVELAVLGYVQLRSEGFPVRLILKDHKGLYGLGVERVMGELMQREPLLQRADIQAGILVISSSLNLHQLRSLYGLADAYVSPYRAEGFNLPVLEAMGCGTWVIVTGGGATDDFVPPALGHRLASRPGRLANAPAGQGRFMAPEVEDLVQALRTVAEGRVPRGPEQEAARQALAERYNWGRVTAELAALF